MRPNASSARLMLGVLPALPTLCALAGTLLLFWLFLLYPAMYYFVYCIPRYRHPIEPEMAILAVFLLTEAGKKTTVSLPDQSSERESA